MDPYRQGGMHDGCLFSGRAELNLSPPTVPTFPHSLGLPLKHAFCFFFARHAQIFGVEHPTKVSKNQIILDFWLHLYLTICIKTHLKVFYTELKSYPVLSKWL